MNPGTILLLFVFAYFIGLLVISYITSRNADNQSFFIGNKKSKWWLVAFGMIGTSLSGVTFISVPGTVGKMTAGDYPFGGFEYYMLVIGFFIGYFIVAFVLLPLYYKMNLKAQLAIGIKFQKRFFKKFSGLLHFCNIHERF